MEQNRELNMIDIKHIHSEHISKSDIEVNVSNDCDEFLIYNLKVTLPFNSNPKIQHQSEI